MSQRALIIGAGNIGLATGAQLVTAGIDVFFWDTDPLVRERVAASGSAVLARFEDRPAFDQLYICVPTPTVDGRFSSELVATALLTTASLLHRTDGFAVVVVRSTLLPGTMDSLVAPLLASHAPAGSYGLAYRPSFARERCALGDEQAPHAVIFGYDGGVATRAALEPSVATLGVPARWVGFREAEMAKYGANLFNALKISYFNALGAWAGEGADGRVVAELAAAASEANWNPGYGFRSVGQPFGGLCLPKDLEAFITHLAETGSPHSSLLEAVREVNESLGGPAAAPAP